VFDGLILIYLELTKGSVNGDVAVIRIAYPTSLLRRQTFSLAKLEKPILKYVC